MFGSSGIIGNNATAQAASMTFVNDGGIYTANNCTTIQGATIYTDTAWPIWCGSVTSSVTDVWSNWVNCTFIGTGSNYTPRIDQRPATPEELAALAARREESRRQDEVRHAFRTQAETKASILLFDNLTEKQKEDLARIRAFFVEGSSGIRYRIRHGRAGNVDAIGRDGKIMYTLCAHPVEDVPDQDTMLAQKLMLEHDDLDFASRANRHARFTAAQVLEPLH